MAPPTIPATAVNGTLECVALAAATPSTRLEIEIEMMPSLVAQHGSPQPANPVDLVYLSMLGFQELPLYLKFGSREAKRFAGVLLGTVIRIDIANHIAAMGILVHGLG